MTRKLWLLCSALLAACSLNPQPEPPLLDSSGAVGGAGGLDPDQSAGTAGSSAAGSAGVGAGQVGGEAPPAADAGVPLNGLPTADGGHPEDAAARNNADAGSLVPADAGAEDAATNADL